MQKKVVYLLRLSPLEVFDEHLLDWFVESPQHMPDTVTAYQMADFLSQILGMVSGTFQRLGHKQDVEALLSL